ncbi:MAG: phosphoribosylaminoimidazolesuccinocarboxamide synthase [Candidatus Thermoplasmatota archaeon]|nr:phosphoribosylaminoimidazolesuccinocarboxamide synthase [Candidatus Thermoplasmatota archaeon]
MKKLIRKGKVKEVYEIGPDELEFHFTDNISVFDKVVPNEIPRKGETLCKTSTYWFEKTEELGFDTHFIEMTKDDKMKVESVEVIEDYDKIGKETTNYLIPLEFIARYFVAGSLHDRIEKGKIDYEKLGFDEKPSYGDRLPEPHFEVTTKLEDYDRKLDREEALSIAGLTEDEFGRIKKMVFEIDEVIEDNVEKNGLLHVDGKKEFAMNGDRELMVIDTFGTADEDRFWEKDEYERGNFVEKSKEFVRQYYREFGYHDELMEAREKDKKEPPIPSLPEEMIEKTSELYLDLMSRLTDGTYGD